MVETKLEFGVAHPRLALLCHGQLATGFEVFERNLKAPSKPAQRLQRGVRLSGSIRET
jgi:hypothetical protein